MQMGDGSLDVALYDESTPEVVAKAMQLRVSDPARRQAIGDPVYVQIQNYPGWGHTVLARLKRLMVEND
jgi:hypothetical protein